MDKLTPVQRSELMSRIRAKDTTPEMIVRRLAHGLGFRYRLHVSTLPGKPDLVFPSRQKVIFIHGCYWHRHRCRKGKSLPATHQEFWVEKFKNNVKRDRQHNKMLVAAGWETLVIWECETKDIQALKSVLLNFLG